MTMSLQRANRIVQGLWDEDVKAWEVHWVPIFRKFAQDLVTMAEISSGQLILDVGTGSGVAAIEAATSATRQSFVFGIDQSAPILSIAKSNCAKKGPRNLRFLLMDERSMEFPNELFDRVISNCGIPLLGFGQIADELFKVLGRGGTLTYNNWHLKDVPVHRIFGEILQEHRTTRPSAELRDHRTALATLERYGNRDMTWETQIRELKRAGFRRTQVRRKIYRISLPSIDEFLEMRFSRATLRQELGELPKAKRTRLYSDLREGLKQFMVNKRFTFDWRITFVRAVKS
jgi:ubiquinone/menaquinone biosynthesis C-methylase UbiE